jgi:aminoglycoside phosphotransferase family enzyme
MTLVPLHQALADPSIYSESTASVEIRETHISLVFLTDEYAYKIKKPVSSVRYQSSRSPFVRPGWI